MKKSGLLIVLFIMGTLAMPAFACECEPMTADKYYTIGDQIRIEDAVITVHEIRYANPMFGDTVFAVDVSIRNIGESMFKVNDQWDLELYDQDGYKLRTAIFPEGRGDGLSTELRPGRTIRGEIAFQPEETSEEYLFIYLYRYSEGLSHKGEVTFYLGHPDMSNEDRQAFVDEHNARFSK